MNTERNTKPIIQARMARWKKALSIFTLMLISICALISLLHISGVLSEILELSTLFAIFTAVFSILVPCCIILTLITITEPSPSSDQEEEADPCKELRVDLPHGMLVYGKEKIRCRQQILLILQYMTLKNDHFISKNDFAGVLDDSTYNCDCESTNAKINTLVSSIRNVLRTLPFEVVNVNRQGYVLNKISKPSNKQE
ncbi:MAG: hypothetical protein ACI4UA_08480 [Bacteroidaceae bacterium]